jgi:hypothetical protein
MHSLSDGAAINQEQTTKNVFWALLFILGADQQRTSLIRSNKQTKRFTNHYQVVAKIKMKVFSVTLVDNPQFSFPVQIACPSMVQVTFERLAAGADNTFSARAKLHNKRGKAKTKTKGNRKTK